MKLDLRTERLRGSAVSIGRCAAAGKGLNLRFQRSGASRLIILAALEVGAVASLPAATLNVPTALFPTIQSAIDASRNGDTIVVGPHTFTETINFDFKNIRVRSTDPSNPDVVSATIIDGGAIGPVVVFGGTETSQAALEGFTITNGMDSVENAAGILGKGCRATIRNNRVINNAGGGIGGVHGLIEGNLVEGNGGTWGGIVFCGGTIRANTVRNNVVTGDYDGGGLRYCDGLIEYNLIESNICGGSGGGLADCYGTIRFNKILGNTAGAKGGGVAQTFVGLPHASSLIRNNILAGNFASIGGGLYEVPNEISPATETTGNVFWQNTADVSAGGAKIPVPSLFHENILWGNTAPANAQLEATGNPAYCLIQGWPSGQGVGIVRTDPRFVDAAGLDFHLQPGSPAIDAANPISLYNDACQPPGLGAARGDLGVYGGPENCGWKAIEQTPTPTPTPIATPTLTPQPTATSTPTPTATETATPLPTRSPSPSSTPNLTPSLTPSATPSPLVSATPSPTYSPTMEPTSTPTPTATSTRTPTPSASPSPTQQPTASPSPVPTAVPSVQNLLDTLLRISAPTGTEDLNGDNVIDAADIVRRSD